MNLRDFDISLTEAPMNPTSFASALKQGASEGVLVGYEFEIVIPKTFDKQSKTDTSKILLLDTISSLSSSWITDMTLDSNDLSILNKVMKIRPEANPAVNSFKEAYKIHNDKGYTTVWDLIKIIFPSKTTNRFESRDLRRNFENYFEITNAKKFLKWLENEYGDLEFSHVEGDYNGKFIPRSHALAELLKSQYNTEVEIFKEYHQATKSLDKWYIEPDGSLDSGDGETALEVVSPPIPAEQAADVLKSFFQIAKTYGFKTGKKYSTGLHINVSIPKKLDMTKLILFLGDAHLLKLFDRVNNEYATGTEVELDLATKHGDLTKVKKQRGKNKVFKSKPKQKTVGFDLKLLKQAAERITGDHYASISNNGKYISFRHVGGDYLTDYQSILNVVGRFVQAMVIASDPEMYKQEYMTKLTKLSNKHSPGIADRDTGNEVKYARAMLNTYQYLKTYGYPIVRIYGVNTDNWSASNSVHDAYPSLSNYLEAYINSGRFIRNNSSSNDGLKQITKYLTKSGITKNKVAKMLVSQPRKYNVEAFLFPDWRDLPKYIAAIKKVKPESYINDDGEHILYRLDHISLEDPSVKMHYVRPFMNEYKSAMADLKYLKLDEAEQAPVYYFAYGMLTDPDYLPGAELLGVGELKNFEFNLYAYANVEPKTGEKVYGALWKIDRNLLGALDKIEAYPELYDRRTYPVYVDGKKYPAEVYLMTPETLRYVGNSTPRQSYINTMIKGYRNAGIPVEQIYDAFYREDLNESLKQAYPYEIATNNEVSGYYSYRFTTDKGLKYIVDFQGNEYTSLAFFHKNAEGYTTAMKTGTGDSYRVLATVIKIVEQFIDEHSPKALAFSSSEYEPSRTKLYRTIIKSLLQNNTEYKVKEENLSGDIMFLLVKNK